MLRRLFCALLCCAAAAVSADPAAPPVPAVYQRVQVEPTKTSIYIGSVAMTMPVFSRKGVLYESTYHARVFPYFFSNEDGRLYIEITESQLQKLRRGEAVDFTGRAIRDDGDLRRVEGRAMPHDAVTGRIKVRVFVTKKIQLIFNTTYRFVGA